MRIVGLITEYNPFHKGHLYHLKESKKITNADYAIVVMSGNFVQRGNPAIADKWTRTKSALMCGADLVIELPVHYATSSAEFFSMASISLLQNTGIVDSICFGSESGELHVLDSVASVLYDEPVRFKELMSDFLAEGYNFPKARAKALSIYLPSINQDIINSPNNILGIEYLKAIKRLKSSIIPFTVKRIGASYHESEITSTIASATAIRKLLNTGETLNKTGREMLPANSYKLLSEALKKKIAPILPEDLFTLIRYKLLLTPKQNLNDILDITEGLENRIHYTFKKVNDYNSLIEALFTKRYTKTKINRALLHILLDINKKDFEIFNNNGYAQYLRILGFKKDAKILLNHMKNKSSLPIIVNIKNQINNLTSIQQKMLYDEIRATEVYNTLILSKFNTGIKNDYAQPIIVVK